MTKEVMEQTIKQRVHEELNHLMCLEAGHNGQAPPPFPFAPVDVPSTEEAPPLIQEANAAMTAKDIKRMIEEVLKDQPAQNTRSKKKRKTEGESSNHCKIVSDKIEKHVAQGYCDGKPVTYCHTHGITTNLEHNSCTCTRRGDAHKATATLRDKKGGNPDRRSARK